jgi:ECF sigma factor
MRESERKAIIASSFLLRIDAKRCSAVKRRVLYTQATQQGQHYQQVEMSGTHEVTLLLAEWAKGNERALDDLTPLVYRELRKLAASYLRKERQGNTLQPTALVHEAYLRLVEQTCAWRTVILSSTGHVTMFRPLAV